MKKRDTGQAYINGLVLDYNYFRPHMGLGEKTLAVSAGAGCAVQVVDRHRHTRPC